MANDRFLAHIIDYDPKTDIIIIKADFLDPERQQTIENMLENKTMFSFWFKKPFRRMKTYPQLKKYFALLKRILVKNEILPESDEMRAFDIEMKKSILPCKQLQIGDKVIPLVKSKAELGIDEMSHLIQEVSERYGIE